MQLFFNPASPFVRKVRMVAIAKALDHRIELVDSVLTPVNPDSNVVARNPIGKIPALCTDSGEWLYDSRVICEYLDDLGSGTELFPGGESRWTALRLQAIGDGICDAAILCRYEGLVREQAQQSDEWISGQMAKVNRALDLLNEETDHCTMDNIGGIAVACALAYLDFRFPELDWRKGRDQLANWIEPVSSQDSFVRTAPE